MQIFVGSTNPVKINAVTQAIAETFPTAVITSVDVPSGISDQPRSDEETRSGAYNRAMAAMNDGFDQLKATPSHSQKKSEILAIGLEGGVFEMTDGELWSTVWACVIDPNGNKFESNGARFKVPEPIAKAIQAGDEMGPVVNKLMGGKDIRRGQGAIGVITNNFIDRTEEYSIIAKMALGLWYGRNWQKGTSIS